MQRISKFPGNYLCLIIFPIVEWKGSCSVCYNERNLAEMWVVVV